MQLPALAFLQQLLAKQRHFPKYESIKLIRIHVQSRSLSYLFMYPVQYNTLFFFCRHYAAKLDGCGLDLENQVRKSYRLMLIRLTEALNSFKKPPSK